MIQYLVPKLIIKVNNHKNYFLIKIITNFFLVIFFSDQNSSFELLDLNLSDQQLIDGKRKKLIKIFFLNIISLV